MGTLNFEISIIDQPLAISRFGPKDPIPAWVYTSDIFSITRTQDELSIISDERKTPGDIVCEKGWAGLKLEGIFAFELTGVLASVITPLSTNGISIFAMSTYNTDYILVKSSQLNQAILVLQKEGHYILKR